MTSSRQYPGIYPKANVGEEVPGFKKNQYLYDIYSKKLDKSDTPNSVYTVDADGNQRMMSIDELVNKSIIEILKGDAPADGKQYTRQDHEWKEKISAVIDDYSKNEDVVRLVVEDYTNEGE